METELERLVVRLVGDGSDYQRMLSTAQTSTNQAAQQVEAASKKIEGFSSGLQGFATAATSALAAIGIGGGLKQMFGAFAEAETISIRLNAVLQSNGRNVEETRQQYNRFAGDIQALTVLDDDAVLSLLNLAESFELTGDAAQEAAKNAISLAAVTGGSAESMIRLTAALAKGDVERAMQMARMVPQLRGITKESEFLAKATQLISTGWETAQAEAGSASGQLKQLSNAFGNLMEDLGEIVAKAIKPLVSWIQKVVIWFQELSPEVKTLIVGFVGLLGAITAIGPVIYIFSALSGPIAAVGTTVLGLLNPLKLLSLGLSAVTTSLGFVRAAATVAFGPIGIAIAVVTALIGTFIATMGGFEETWILIKETAIKVWEAIKAKVTEFIEWSKPIVDALVVLWLEAWELMKEGINFVWDTVKVIFTTIKDFVVGVWTSISGGATTNWEGIRETIVTVIDFCTFTLRNFGQVASFVWTGIKLSAVTAFDMIRDAIVVASAVIVGIVKALGATFAALWNNMTAGAQRAINFVRAGWEGLKAAAEAVLNLRNPMRAFREAQQRELTRLNAESRQFQDVGQAAASAFNNGFDDTVEALGGVGQSRMQQQLRREFEEQGAALGQSFEEFQRARRAASAGGAIDDPDSPTNPMAPVLAAAKGANKEIEKFDAALRNSAEATSRINAYIERMKVAPTRTSGGGTGTIGGGMPTPSSTSPPTLPTPSGSDSPSSIGSSIGSSGPRPIPTTPSISSLPSIPSINLTPILDQIRTVTTAISGVMERIAQVTIPESASLSLDATSFYSTLDQVQERINSIVTTPLSVTLDIPNVASFHAALDQVRQRVDSLSTIPIAIPLSSSNVGSNPPDSSSVSQSIDTTPTTQVDLTRVVQLLTTEVLQTTSSTTLLVAIRDHLKTIVDRPRIEVESF